MPRPHCVLHYHLHRDRACGAVAVRSGHTGQLPPRLLSGGRMRHSSHLAPSHPARPSPEQLSTALPPSRPPRSCPSTRLRRQQPVCAPSVHTAPTRPTRAPAPQHVGPRGHSPPPSEEGRALPDPQLGGRSPQASVSFHRWRNRTKKEKKRQDEAGDGSRRPRPACQGPRKRPESEASPSQGAGLILPGASLCFSGVS